MGKVEPFTAQLSEVKAKFAVVQENVRGQLMPASSDKGP